MAITAFSKEIVIPFVPRYGGNRDDEVKTVVRLRPLNNDGSIEFTEDLTKALLACDGDQDQEIAVRAEQTRKVFVDHIDSVENYPYIEASGAEGQIKTGDELFANGSKSVVDEVTLAMENSSILSAGQLKNFEGGSSGISLPDEKKASPSTVPPAEKKKDEKEIAATGEGPPSQ